MLMSLNDRLSRSNFRPEKPMSLSDPMWLSHLSDLSHEA